MSQRNSPRSLPDNWFSDSPLKHVVLKMHLGDKQALAPPSPGSGAADPTSLLSDVLLSRILSSLPEPLAASLVCRRWLRLIGSLRRRATVLRWSFVPRIPLRFPDISDLDLLPASFAPASSSPILLTRGAVSIPLDLHSDHPVGDSPFLSSESLDRAIDPLARGCPGLRRLSLVAPVSSESGLLSLAEQCDVLQELELHCCTDHALRPISAFVNLQILKLVGSVEGLYRGPGVTDVGLTILAHGCKRLVKLELSGCEGSYDGISAVGRCCLMLEEITISHHRMDAGWLAGLSFCCNLKTLRLQGCRRIDSDPGPTEHLGSCPAIERLQLQRCQLRDKKSLQALFMVCEAAREIIFQNCWGLDKDMFTATSICRRVKLLSLEGCPSLTTEALASVILAWQDLQRLTVVSCNDIKDGEVTPAMSGLFSTLKELKWRPDSRSTLAASLTGTGMGKKGGRFFRRA